MSAIETWSTTAGLNNAASPNGFPEGMAQNGYNNSVRELMAALKAWYTDPEYLKLSYGYTVTRDSATVVRIWGVNLTAVYAVGRRVKLRGGGDTIGTVTAVSFPAADTLVTVASVPVGTTAIDAHFGSSLRSAAFLATGNTVGQVVLHTSTGPLLTGAYKNHGNAIGELALHSQTGPLLSGAYYTPATHRSFTNLTGGNQAYTLAAEIAISGMAAIAIPGGGDGVKKFRVTAVVQYNGETASQDLDIRLHVGAAGLITDPELTRVETSVGTNDEMITLSTYIITPANGHLVTIGLRSDQNGTIYKNATNSSWLAIERVQ
jgi:hypothetical protein